jgi:hypothetical protein
MAAEQNCLVIGFQWGEAAASTDEGAFCEHTDANIGPKVLLLEHIQSYWNIGLKAHKIASTMSLLFVKKIIK